MNYLIAMTVIPLLMFAWVGVQFVARWYAARHPEFGPAKEEGGGCGGSCLCAGKELCQKERKI
jgi:hypothetical protein